MKHRMQGTSMPSSYQENVLFEDLYKQYVSKVYQKCYTMTKDSITAHDYTQDIFLKVWSKLDTFKNTSSLSTWLYSIAHNYCLDQIRIGKRFNLESLSELVSDKVYETEHSGLGEEHLEAMEWILESLPSEEVYFLKLRHEQGLSIRELAMQYQISESAVKMRLKRTRDRAKRLIATIAS